MCFHLDLINFYVLFNLIISIMQRSESKPKKSNSSAKNLTHFVKKNENDIANLLTALDDNNEKLESYEKKQKELKETVLMMKKEFDIFKKEFSLNLDLLTIIAKELRSLQLEFSNLNDNQDSLQMETQVNINNESDDDGIECSPDSSIDSSDHSDWFLYS